MSRTLLPLPGHPQRLRMLADALAGGAARLSAVNTVLLGLRAGVRWDSPSGHAFEAAVQAPPPVIAAVIERYAGASRALRTLADALETAQDEVARATHAHHEAWRRHDLFLARRDVAVDPVERGDLERAMDSQVALVAEAERRHARAVEHHREADRSCARALRLLARDAIDDTTAYTAVVGAGTVSNRVAMVGGMLPGRLKLIGVAGAATGTLSDAFLLVLWDEGSWKEVGKDALVAVGTAAGSVMVAGSALGVRVAVQGGRRVFTKVCNPSTGIRIGAGARTTFDDWVTGWRRRLGQDVAATPPRIVPRPLPPVPTVAQRVGHRAQRAVDDAFLDGWRAASASGHGAQQMFVAGMTLRQGPKVAKQVGGVHDRLTTPPPGNSEEKGGRPTYP
ncbi:hypothetical protein ACOCJ5_15510 [Knoellia sp. CPCC 206450]|uniref:hypothetical protein n=1 Tax=Knoellia tibetensis TaxID=3404798 RepID=UPI003B42AD86